MEEVKIVVMDNGRLMAQFDDGSLAPLRPLLSAAGVYVDYFPNKKETNYA